MYVATRNDALASVIEKCPDSRKSDLVFYGQNGLSTSLCLCPCLCVCVCLCLCLRGGMCIGHQTHGLLSIKGDTNLNQAEAKSWKPRAMLRMHARMHALDKHLIKHARTRCTSM